MKCEMSTETNLEESAGGLVLEGHRVLLVHQTKTDTWAFPKGHVFPAETVLAAALREIHEESGQTGLHFLQSLGSYQRSSRKAKGVVKKIHMLLFRARCTELVCRSSDVDQCQWLAFSDAKQRLFYRQDRDFLVRCLPILNTHIEDYPSTTNTSESINGPA